MRDYGTHRELIQWPTLALKRYDPAAAGVEPSDEDWLQLDDDYARAYVRGAGGTDFGHAGHDTRALRRDYDAERARVDKLIGHLVAR